MIRIPLFERWFVRVFSRWASDLELRMARLEKQMATKDDFLAALDAAKTDFLAGVTAETAEVNAKLDVLNAAIQALKDQIANSPGPDFTDEIAAVQTAFADAKTAVGGIVTPDAPPA